MVRSLPGPQHIGVPSNQREVGPTVLQRKATAGRHNAGAKPHVVAVDEAACIASRIYDTEVDSVAAGHRAAMGCGLSNNDGEKNIVGKEK